MSREGVRELASAMRRSAKRESARAGTGRYEGVVLDTDPLRVDIIGLDGTLDEDDIAIGTALAAHLDDEPLEADDVLVLVENADGDYDAVDVVRD